MALNAVLFVFAGVLGALSMLLRVFVDLDAQAAVLFGQAIAIHHWRDTMRLPMQEVEVEFAGRELTVSEVVYFQVEFNLPLFGFKVLQS